MRSLLLPIVCTALLSLNGCALRREPAGKETVLEVAIFEGGYGIEWHRSVAREYERRHPGIKIDLWGDPRVDEKLKPRILRGNPPDLASCRLPEWKLIVAGKLYPLDSALDSPAYGLPGTWRETLLPGLLTPYAYQGRHYAMPSNFGAWVCWYNRKQFRKHGWKVPHTWSEFQRLCAQIQAAGIAPLAFQGKYPTYAWATLLSLYQRLVPFERWDALQDIRPGAFLDPEFIHAARLFQETAVRSFAPGALAMTHTESQLQWVNGRAALVFCGLWLKNEMKNALPPDFEMACFPIPMVEGGQGDAHAVYGGGAENFFVFAEGRHPREALDFLKYMISIEPARAYIRQLDTLTPVREAAKGVALSPELQSAVDVLNHSSRTFSDRLSSLYLEFGKTILPDALAGLVSGKITPEAFAGRLEEAMERVRRNPDIYKPPSSKQPANALRGGLKWLKQRQISCHNAADGSMDLRLSRGASA